MYETIQIWSTVTFLCREWAELNQVCLNLCQKCLFFFAAFYLNVHLWHSFCVCSVSVKLLFSICFYSNMKHQSISSCFLWLTKQNFSITVWMSWLFFNTSTSSATQHSLLLLHLKLHQHQKMWPCSGSGSSRAVIAVELRRVALLDEMDKWLT